VLPGAPTWQERARAARWLLLVRVARVKLATRVRLAARMKLGLGYYDGCIALEDDSFVCGGTSNEFGVVPAALGVSLLSLAGSR